MKMIATLTVTMLVFLSSTVSGDYIELKDGRAFEGCIRNETDKSLSIESQGSLFTLPFSSISRVMRASDCKNHLLEGDQFLEAGVLDKAILSYRNAYGADPEKARVKIEEVYSRLLEQMETQLEGADVNTIRAKLTGDDRGMMDFERVIIRKLISGYLMRCSRKAEDEIDYKQSLSLLEEAWLLDPDYPGLCLNYVRGLDRYSPGDVRINHILKTHMKRHPEDMDAVEFLVYHVWKKDPWKALELLYPGKAPHPRATEGMRKLIPGVLLACFQSDHCPRDAVMNRSECYEHLMDLRPDTSPLPLLEHQVMKEPRSARGYFQLGEYYYNLRKFDKAIPCLKEALSLEESEPTRHILTRACEYHEKIELREIRALLKKGQITEAQTRCENLLLLVKHSPGGYQLLQHIVYLDFCPVCGGRGKAPCKRCGGTGQIKSKKTIEEKRKILEPVSISEIEKKIRAFAPHLWKAYMLRYRDERIHTITITGPAKNKIFDLMIFGSNPTRAFRCNECDSYIMIDNPSMLDQKCPICGEEGDSFTKTVTASERCPDCGGTGVKGVCQNCGGSGVIRRKIPRKSSINMVYMDMIHTLPDMEMVHSEEPEHALP